MDCSPFMLACAHTQLFLILFSVLSLYSTFPSLVFYLSLFVSVYIYIYTHMPLSLSFSLPHTHLHRHTLSSPSHSFPFLWEAMWERMSGISVRCWSFARHLPHHVYATASQQAKCREGSPESETGDCGGRGSQLGWNDGGWSDRWTNGQPSLGPSVSPHPSLA